MMSADDNEVAGLASLWKSGQHLRVGADYLDALQKLGLNPDCLFWADDEVVKHPVLVLVTRHFDRVGPLALSELLFKAYDAAATPREINPFVLRLHSPEQTVIQGLVNAQIDEVLKDRDHVLQLRNAEKVFLTAGGMKFHLSWVYKWELSKPEPSRMAMTRQWRRFTENVDRLAA